MNRTDRLLAIVLELQGKGRRRAEDLAATFETSKRTIYRDIQALCEAGVPVVALPGQGYTLVQGYFLPPVHFTADEATVLLLGGDVMAQSFDARYRDAALAASRKVEAVLPEAQRPEVARLRQGLRFVARDALDTPGAPEKLQRLRQAIDEQHTVRFRYHSPHHPDAERDGTLREADPYQLIHVSDAWYVQAYCHSRRALRRFRLDRIEALEVLEARFERLPEHAPRRPISDDRTLTVRVLFNHSAARWVREGRFYYRVAEEERADGLLVTLRARHESELLPWLLSWGAQARVLEPAALCQRIADEAAALLQHYRAAETLLT